MGRRTRVAQDLIYATVVGLAFALLTLANDVVVRGIAAGAGAGLGLAFSERVWLRGWAVNLTRAARLLMQQERNPSLWVYPSIDNVNLFPGTSTAEHDIDLVDYIELVFIWDNDLYRSVRIAGIRGTVQVNSVEPPAVLPPDVPDEVIQALRWSAHKEPIKLALTGAALAAVRKVRREKQGDVGLTIRLRARLDGEDSEFPTITYRAFYRP